MRPWKPWKARNLSRRKHHHPQQHLQHPQQPPNSHQKHPLHPSTSHPRHVRRTTTPDERGRAQGSRGRGKPYGSEDHCCCCYAVSITIRHRCLEEGCIKGTTMAWVVYSFGAAIYNEVRKRPSCNKTQTGKP